MEQQINEKRQLMMKAIDRIAAQLTSLDYRLVKSSIQEEALINTLPRLTLTPGVPVILNQQDKLERYNIDFEFEKIDIKNMTLKSSFIYNQNLNMWFSGFDLYQGHRQCSLSQLLSPPPDLSFKDSANFEQDLNKMLDLAIGYMSNEWHDYLIGKVWKYLPNTRPD